MKVLLNLLIFFNLLFINTFTIDMCCESIEDSINKKIQHASHHMTETNQMSHDCHDEEKSDDNESENHDCHSACCTTFSVIEFKINKFVASINEYKIGLSHDVQKSPKNIIIELFRPPALT